MSKTLNKYITVHDYKGRTALAMSVASNNVFYFSFTAVIGMPVGIENASISPMFLIVNAIVKLFLKIRKQKKIAFLAKSKFNSIEKKT